MNDHINSLALTSDKKYLFVSDVSGDMKQIDVATDKVIKNFGKIHSSITAIAIDKKNEFVFTSDKNEGLIKRWSIETGKLVKLIKIEPKNNGTRFMLITKDNKYLFCANRKVIDVIDIRTNNIAHSVTYSALNVAFYHVRMLEIVKDFKVLVLDISGRLRLIRSKDGLPQQLPNIERVTTTTSMALYKNETQLFVSDDVRIILVNLNPFAIIRSYENVTKRGIIDICLNSDESMLYIGTKSGFMVEWSTKEKKQERALLICQWRFLLSIQK